MEFKPQNSAAELRRVLHLVADAAILADDARDRGDADEVRRAVAILASHLARLQSLTGGTSASDLADAA